MSKRTSPAILQNYDAELSARIAQLRSISRMEALQIFLDSETHEMLMDNELKMWYFSPLAILDMWETEEATGDPRDSLYLKGDEVG